MQSHATVEKKKIDDWRENAYMKTQFIIVQFHQTSPRKHNRISRGDYHKNNSFPYLPMKHHLNHNLSVDPNFSAKSLLETNKLSNKLTNKLILKMLMITNLIILLLCNQLSIQ